MKWVNLAERQPDINSIGLTHFRYVKDSYPTDSTKFYFSPIDERWFVWGRDRNGNIIHTENLKDYEWLDESAEEHIVFREDPLVICSKAEWDAMNAPGGYADQIRKNENFLFWGNGDGPKVHSSDDVEEGHILISVPIGSLIIPPGQITNYHELQWLEYKKGNQSFRQYLENVYPDETRVLLAEQHRNTRHDAIEAITATAKKTSLMSDTCIELLLQMQRDIMNLQQRKP